MRGLRGPWLEVYESEVEVEADFSGSAFKLQVCIFRLVKDMQALLRSLRGSLGCGMG